MEPLGFYMYFKNNKKKVLTIIVTLVLSAFLIVVIGILGNNLDSMEKKSNEVYDYYSMIWSYNQIPKELSEELKNNPYVDRIIIGRSVNAQVRTIIGNSMYLSGMELDKKSLEYVFNKMRIDISNTELTDGDFIGSKILLNNIGCKVGESIDNKTYGFSRLKDKKLIKTAYNKKIYMFFIVREKNNIQNMTGNIYIFPKEGQLEYLNKSLKKYDNKKFNVVTKEKYKEDMDSMNSSFYKLLNIFSITIIIVISVILGNSYYLHYMERRHEFGILKALGYKRSYILKRMIKEIILVNLIGSSLYFLLIEMFMKFMNEFYMLPKGLPMLELYKEGIISLISLPVFIFIFSLIPIYVFLGKMDSVSIIERMG